MKPSIDIDPEFLDNCAIREFTADGVSVGRCWMYCGKEAICPRHGDVRYVQDHYMRTGELTNEMNHKVVKDLSKP